MEASVIQFQKRLKHPWIRGISAKLLESKFNECIIRHAHDYSILIATHDAKIFFCTLLAGLALGKKVILANPNWKKKEWNIFGNQMKPSCSVGSNIPVDQSKWIDCMPPFLTGGYLLIPTGGTTGKIRFVWHTWYTLSKAVNGLFQFINETAPINALCILPYYHVSGLMQAMRTFITGGNLFISNWKNLINGNLFNIDKNQKINYQISLVPTQLRIFMNHSNGIKLLKYFSWIFVGGAPLHSSLLNQAIENNLQLAPCYGCTETAAMVTLIHPKTFLKHKVGVGNCLPHAKITAIDPLGNELPKGSIGLLKIQAKSLYLGYYPNLPKKKNFFVSADKGFINKSNQLIFVGRKDRIIITGGKKVDPQEVEESLMSTGKIKDVLVIGHFDLFWGECITAFYIPSVNNIQLDLSKELKDILKKNIVSYKIPKYWICVKKLPLTIQGKINHEELNFLLKKLK